MSVYAFIFVPRKAKTPRIGFVSGTGTDGAKAALRMDTRMKTITVQWGSFREVEPPTCISCGTGLANQCTRCQVRQARLEHKARS